MNRMATDSTPRSVLPAMPRLRVPSPPIDGWVAGLIALALAAPLVVGIALYALAALSATRPADLRDSDEYEQHEGGFDPEEWPGAPCCWDVR